MWINGLTNKVDVINSIIDNIDDNDLATARDSLNQLKDIETDEELDGPSTVVMPVPDHLNTNTKLMEKIYAILDFWPMTIVVPIMLILILLGVYFQW